MNTKAIAAVLFGFFISCAAIAAPVTSINFEDIEFSQPVQPADYKLLSDGYQGLKWSGEDFGRSWVISVDSDTFFSGSYGREGAVTVSGHNYAWSNAGSWLSIERDAGFDVLSMWVRQGYSVRNANLPPSDYPIVFHGFRDNVEVYSSTVITNTTYQEVELDFKHIDRLVIDNNGANMLIDDIEVRLNHIPEPSSLALIGLAAIALGFASRRKHKK